MKSQGKKDAKRAGSPVPPNDEGDVSRRAFLTLSIGGVTAALVTSCGGGGGDSGGTTAAFGAGSVGGWLYRDAAGKVRLAYSAALPAGATPVRSATVTVAGTTASATTAADGSFTLTGIPAGLGTLTAKLGADSVQVPLTIVNKATVLVGDPPVTRSVAASAAKIEAAKIGDLKKADMLGTQQPLPAGVAVTSTLNHNDRLPTPPVPFTFASPQWLFYFDLSPQAKWMHDVLYVFVDAATGAITTKHGVSWPALNDCSYYALADANVTSPDLIQAGTRASVAVAAPEPPATTRAAPTRDHLDMGGCTNPKTYALLIRGDTGAGMEYDVGRVKSLFGSDPFPTAAQIYELICPGPANPKATMLAYLADMFKKAQACDYVVVYITSHGSAPPDHVFFLNRGTRTAADGTLVKISQTTSPTELDFSNCKACHIVVIVDTCYSGNWMPLTQTSFQSLNGREVVLMTASDASHTAIGLAQSDTFKIGSDTIDVPRGGLFTTMLLKEAAAAFTTPMLDPDLAAVYGLAVPLVNQANSAQGDPRQSPQAWQRTIIPGEKCESGSSTVTIK
jgi:hypothetical protein